MAHYDHTYVVPGESGPRRAPTTDPADRDVSSYPHDVRGQRLHHGRRDLLRGHQPGPQEGLRHPHRDAGAGRPGPPDARALGRHGRRRHRGGAGRPPRRLSRVPAGDRVAAGAAARLPAHRRAGHLHRRHAVPAVVEEGGPGDQRAPAATGRSSCSPTCPASTARPTRCATSSWSTAPRSAGRSSTSTGPIVFCVISRYHGGAFVVFSKALNPNMTVLALEGSYASVIGGAPAAAVVFAGEVDKRTVGRPAGPRARGAARRDATGAGAEPAGRRARRAAGRGAPGEDRRGRRRVRRRPRHPPGGAGRLGRRGDLGARLRPRMIEAIERGLVEFGA